MEEIEGKAMRLLCTELVEETERQTIRLLCTEMVEETERQAIRLLCTEIVEDLIGTARQYASIDVQTCDMSSEIAI